MRYTNVAIPPDAARSSPAEWQGTSAAHRYPDDVPVGLRADRADRAVALDVTPCPPSVVRRA